MKVPDLFGLELLDASLGSVAGETIAGFPEEAAPHFARGGRQQVILLRFDARQLKHPFALESLVRKGGLQNDICNQIEARVEVLAHDFGVHSKAVVPAIAFNAAAERFNLGGNLLGGTSRSALKKHFGHEQGASIVVRLLRQDAALEYRSEFHEGQPVVFLYE